MSSKIRNIFVAMAFLAMATGAPQVNAQSNPNDPVSTYGGGAADAAEKAAGKQDNSQMMAMMMAAMLASQCGPHNHAACIMSALAAAQAMSLGGTSDKARSVASQLSSYGKPLNQTNPGGQVNNGVSDGNGVNSSPVNLNQIRQDLANKGFTLSPDGSKMTLPDGSNVPTASMGTAEGMKAAGLSDADIAAGMAAVNDAQKAALSKIKGVGMDADGGGGGGAGGAGGAGTVSTEAGGFKMPSFKLPGGDDKAKGLAGMSKSFGGDKIGVAGDNIFEMITRRYKAREAVNNFLQK